MFVNHHKTQSHSKKRLLLSILALAGVLSMKPAVQNLFAASAKTEVKLKGLRVVLGEPVQVTAQLPWHTTSIAGAYSTPGAGQGEGGAWSFIHPTPTIARFDSGELIVTYSLVADTNANPAYMGAFQASTDGGKTWGHRYEVLPEHQPMIFVPQKDGSQMAIPAQLYPKTPGDKHNFHGAYIRFEKGGRRMIFEPAGVKVVDWPWPVGIWRREAPETNWYANMAFDGSAIRTKGRLIATGYARKEGEKMQQALVMASQDEGRTWRYFSTIAEPPLGDNPKEKGYGGPSETAMIELANGDLMAVFRVGSGGAWPLYQSYSSDGGKIWTKSERTVAYSVEPSMLRIQNGAIVLASGRPGMRLWISTDGRGKAWQDVDIVEHHNKWAPNPNYQIQTRKDLPESRQTSSYTGLVETSPNHMILVYDRGAKPSPSSGEDRTRIFVMPIEVQRE